MNYSSFNVIKYISIAHRKFDWFNLNEIFRRKNKLRQPITFYLHENFINLWPLEKIFLRLLFFSLINFKHENPWNNFFNVICKHTNQTINKFSNITSRFTLETKLNIFWNLFLLFFTFETLILPRKIREIGLTIK